MGQEIIIMRILIDKNIPLYIAVVLSVTFWLVSPASLVAYSQVSYYNQSYYQFYYQNYYQTYYQAYYQAYYQGTSQTGFNSEVIMEATLDITGAISKGSGSFVIDHPLDPENKLLYHSFVESPDVKNIYDGVVTLDAWGEAVVQLPDYFEKLNKDYRYQVKAIDTPAPNLHIKDEIKDNRFTIAGGPQGTKVSWQVTGVRKDPYILANPIINEVYKGPDELVDVGEYLFEENRNNILTATLSNIWSLFNSIWSWFSDLF